ncbi:CRR6 family NdhI maturation factor [Spirulina major CS-329]|uniref:CRR6 family NdhI maturation factor n=1 Tax=Spirulina TaxID=1154 RepID=UPI002330DA48|nr:CRR6 family NdhI maturation factor [Spirulina major]MDB9505260.1 CRR6 family NdhI maturation factor [Spirulina major CS-329]
MTTITLNLDHLTQLDLEPVTLAIAPLLAAPLPTDPDPLRFTIEIPRDPTDPRELSELPEVRLWFIRLDAVYPWLPYYLDWATELARYTAMLVPHQFSRSEGIQFNPEALEIFIMAKVFAVHRWLQSHNLDQTGKLRAMTQTLGYDLDSRFFEQLG